MSHASPRRELIERLAEEIENAGIQGLLPSDDARAISGALRGENTGIRPQLIVPTRVIASIKTMYSDLSYARCAKCGRVFNLLSNGKLLKSLKCPYCGSPLVPSVVWCITQRNLPGEHRLSTQWGIPLTLSIENYGGTTPDKIKIIDYSRPLANLRFYLAGREVEYLPLIRRRAYVYLLSLMPSESITKPITITAFAYHENECTKIDFTTGSFPGIAKIMFCENLEVLQATIAYRAGHYRSTTSSRVPVLDIRDSPHRGRVVRIPIRYIRTKGLVIKVDKSALKPVIKSLGYSESEGIWR
ncbi:MAG: hypothetical protein DRN04_14895, partial [Thermoprotei archaeon]